MSPYFSFPINNLTDSAIRADKFNSGFLDVFYDQ